MALRNQKLSVRQKMQRSPSERKASARRKFRELKKEGKTLDLRKKKK